MSLVVLTLSATASVVIAQASLPGGVTNTDEVVTPEQRKKVAQYVADWVKQLRDGDGAQLTEARRQLLEPLGAGGGGFFKTIYSAEVSRALLDAARSDRMVVRLNSMIITTQLTDAGAVDLILEGLSDVHSAPRYWAAKAVAMVASRANLNSKDQIRLLDGLTKQFGKETYEPVLQQMMRGLGVLDIPEAAPKLLEGMNQRVDVHAKNASLALKAELESLRRLLRRLIKDAAGGAVSPDLVRQFAIVAVRLENVSATLLQAGAPAPIVWDDHEQMIETCDTILKWATEQLGVDAAGLPAALQQNIKVLLAGKNWALIKLRVAEWSRLLEKSLGFKRDELTVKFPDL